MDQCITASTASPRFLALCQYLGGFAFFLGGGGRRGARGLGVCTYPPVRQAQEAYVACPKADDRPPIVNRLLEPAGAHMRARAHSHARGLYLQHTSRDARGGPGGRVPQHPSHGMGFGTIAVPLGPPKVSIRRLCVVIRSTELLPHTTHRLRFHMYPSHGYA